MQPLSHGGAEEDAEKRKKSIFIFVLLCVCLRDSRAPRLHLFPIPPPITIHPSGTATFSDFIQLLETQGELIRIKSKVDPILEIAEICDRVCKTPAPHGHNEKDRTIPGTLGGRAAPFLENVQGSDIPVAINTFGSYHRVNLALGTESLDALAGSGSATRQTGDADEVDGEDEEGVGPDQVGELSAEEGS